MADPQQAVIDKSLRSVFVGNIPYDVTEEKLKDIFSEAGPVVSFKIVYDRETGKPKGYGFCEYRDQETALCAMRNLNAYEIAGRTLRVDNACTEKSRLEMQSLMQEKTMESPYGDPVDPIHAPEAISKTVSSLPPEQMFELMHQMKQCVQNNPNEARQMLLQNPQLGYALLQALVIMRVVDPNNALTMLQKGPGLSDGSVTIPQQHYAANKPFAVPTNEPWAAAATAPGPPRSGLLGDRPFVGQDLDLRHSDPRMGRGDHDLRVMPGPGPGPGPAPPMGSAGGIVGIGAIPPAARPPQPMGDMDGRRDPRSIAPTGPRDPRAGMNRPPAPTVQQGGPPTAPPVPAPPPAAPAGAPGAGGQWAIGSGTSDEEKAALIMQVLQLSDQQIALLPPDQRQSIMVLKEQIARSSR